MQVGADFVARLGRPDPTLVFVLGVFTCNGEVRWVSLTQRFISNWKAAVHLRLGWNFADCFTQRLGI